jgi:hypothetical protein
LFFCSSMKLDTSEAKLFAWSSRFVLTLITWTEIGCQLDGGNGIPGTNMISLGVVTGTVERRMGVSRADQQTGWVIQARETDLKLF